MPIEVLEAVNARATLAAPARERRAPCPVEHEYEYESVTDFPQFR